MLEASGGGGWASSEGSGNQGGNGIYVAVI
jgi:hypothetical protein